MRNDQWLTNKLEEIWIKYFSDIKKNNMVIIRFGQHARTRLGSIRQTQSRHSEPIRQAQGKLREESRRSFTNAQDDNIRPSVITITGYFKDEIVPEFVVDLVIAHELCHYAHGFCSPHPQLYKNPHQGKVIDKELYRRGFGEEIKKEKAWLKTEWPLIIKSRVTGVNQLRRKRRISAQSIIKLLISNY